MFLPEKLKPCNPNYFHEIRAGKNTTTNRLRGYELVFYPVPDSTSQGPEHPNCPDQSLQLKSSPRIGPWAASGSLEIPISKFLK